MECKFSQTRLLVINFKDCFLFYRDIMGFKCTYGCEDDVYASFDAGGVSLALFGRQNMSEAIATDGLPLDAKAQDRVCVCLQVKDIDAACEELKHKGIGLVAEPTDRKDWGERTAHFRDPDGNLIEINQPLPHQ